MRIFFSAILFLPIFVCAQFSDNFNDGDFDNDPKWFGDTSKFVVNQDYELQLNDTSLSGKAILYTACSAIFDASWEFSLKMEFNPSSSNYAKVYLLSNTDSPEISANGYFVKIGNTADEISLYRQDGTDDTEIIDGLDKRISLSLVECRIKVSRDSIGNWELLSDTTGGSNYFQEGSVFDNTYIAGGYFATFCNYTSTRATKFYFDSIIVTGTPYIDTIPPSILNVSILSGNEIEIEFSGSPDSSIYSLENYLVNNNVGNPDSIVVKNDKVYLFFNNFFPDQTNLVLNIQNIKDQENNIMETYSFNFSYYYPKTFDIVINEIMADPTPSQGLPPYEYLELYNKSGQQINLENWQLTFGSNTKIFPEYVMNPDEYLIICYWNALNDLNSYGNTLSLFSSESSLLNTGSTMTLKNEFLQVIHSVTYSEDLHEFSFQKEGGWSLEQVDPNNPCNIISNWKTSTNKIGGTPGQKNSVFAGNPDLDFPHLIRTGYINDSAFSVFFSEPVDSISAFNILNYEVDNNIGYPVKIEWNETNYSSVKLLFNKPFQKRIIYELSIKNTITDCVGNKSDEQVSTRFAIPESASKEDIIINEILFNPVSDGEDYVEIYNLSDKTIDLNGLIIASRDEENFEIIQSSRLSYESYLFYPKEYIALTPGVEQVITQYNPSADALLFEVTELPSFNNGKGRVVVLTLNGEIVDEMEYNEDMHFDLLNDVEGVSLERISSSSPSNEKDNWHSAADYVNYGTPGYKNSQSKETENLDLRISIEPEIFSPDNDGFNDILFINFLLDEPGYLVNISIYDPKGRLIKKLANNYLLGTETSLNWDGISEEARITKTGIYMIYIELFNLKGEVERIRRTCVLAGRMD